MWAKSFGEALTRSSQLLTDPAAATWHRLFSSPPFERVPPCGPSLVHARQLPSRDFPGGHWGHRGADSGTAAAGSGDPRIRHCPPRTPHTAPSHLTLQVLCLASLSRGSWASLPLRGLFPGALVCVTSPCSRLTATRYPGPHTYMPGSRATASIARLPRSCAWLPFPPAWASRLGFPPGLPFPPAFGRRGFAAAPLGGEALLLRCPSAPHATPGAPRPTRNNLFDVCSMPF